MIQEKVQTQPVLEGIKVGVKKETNDRRPQKYPGSVPQMTIDP